MIFVAKARFLGWWAGRKGSEQGLVALRFHLRQKYHLQPNTEE